MKKILIASLIILLLFGEDTVYAQNIKYDVIETKEIKLNSETNDMTVNAQYKEINGMKYLFRFWDYQTVSNPQQLEIINLTEEKVEKRIQFPLYGQNAFTEVVNFYVHNFDSIFFHNEAFPLTFYLTDTSKNIKQKWEIDNMGIGAGWHSTASPFLIEDKLYFYSISTQSFYPDDEDFLDHNILSYLDLNYGLISAISAVDYPEILQENFNNEKWYPWSEKPIFYHHDDNVFVSFTMTPDITIIENGETKNLKISVDKKSSNAVSFDTNDFASNQIHLIEKPLFGKIIYDPYRKKIIRLYKNELEINESADRTNLYYRSTFSLLFFDLNGKLVATLELPKNKINPSIIIPTEQGLLINTDNPFNPQNHEEYLEFDHINIDILH